MICLAAALALLLGAAAPAAPPGCTCAAARDLGGWCAVHDLGYIGGLEIKSAWLYDTLDAHGHDLDLSTFVCPSCRRAIGGDGYCDEHRIGFVRKKAYFSWLTYALAHGTHLDPAAIRCKACRAHAATFGWCERDRVGMIGSVAIADRAFYDRTIAALSIVKLANEAATRCKYCAAAIVTDTTCPICKIRYKDGRPITR
jgi:hypothetical protein